MPVSYIGITDFMTQQNVYDMLAILEEYPPLFRKRSLGVGVMMSYKTLHGIPTKWAAAFPKNEDIASIFIKHERVYNVLHYADHEPLRTDGSILKSLTQARSWGGPHLDAIQLDMVWPNPHDVRQFRLKNPEIQIIFQADAKALAIAQNDPEIFIELLRSYDDVVDCVLLDKSMGQGLGMNAKELLPFARACHRKLPNLALAVAGGLGPDTLNLAEPLIAEFFNISLDAQSRLRPSGSALDPVDWDMAGTYLREALEYIDDIIDDTAPHM